MSLAGYSAFDHLVSALFLAPESLMAIIVRPDPLTLYGDRSAVLDDRLTIVAAAISTVAEWREFDAKWSKALKDEHLEYFHMVDFAQSKCQFAKGWKDNEARRRGLIQALTTIIVKHVKHWVAISVLKSDYDAADKVYRLHEYLRPYPLCGVACVEVAHQWRTAQRLDCLPIEYVFEEGDPYHGQLRDRIEEDYGKEPLFRAKIPRKAKKPLKGTDPIVPTVPLQAADFIAYETGKLSGLLGMKESQLFERFRESFGLIGGIPHKWKGLSELEIRTELNLRGLKKRKP